MKYLTLSALWSLCAWANAASITVSASPGGTNQWQYALTNHGNSLTQFPVYFALPIDPSNGVMDAGIGVPSGWGAYGHTTTTGSAECITFGAAVGSSPLQMPQPGGTLSGFSLLTSVPTVLQSTGVLYGLGDLNTNEIVSEGEVLGPVPVPGTTQVTANLSLESFVAAPGVIRYGQLIFQGPGLPHFAVAGVDGQGTLLCSGPATPGTYTVTLRFFGYLQRVVTAVVAGNSCTFSTTLIPGDVDSSGEIDAVDIDLVIAAFGDISGGLEDLDGSSEVDAVDIDITIANFGLVSD